MLPILEFIFSSFWVWAGSTVMLAILAGAVERAVVILTTAFHKTLRG